MQQTQNFLIKLTLAALSFGIVGYAHGQSTQIPDEINVAKYQGIYETSKRISDQKRALADGAREALGRANQDLLETKSLIFQTETQIGLSEETIQKLTAEISALRSQNDSERLVMNQHQQSIAQDQAIIQSEQTQIARLTNEQSQAVTVRNRMAADLEQALQVERSLLQAFERDRSERDQAKTTLDQAKVLAQNLRNQIATLSQKQGQLTNERAAIETNAPKIREKIQALKPRVNNLASRVQSLQGEVNAANTQVQNQSIQVQDLSKRLEDLNHQVQLVERNLGATRSEIAVLDREIKEKRLAIGNKNQELSALGSEKASIQSQLKGLDTDRLKLETEMAKLERSVSDLTSKHASVEREIKSKLASLMQLERTDPKNPSIPKLRAEVEALKKEESMLEKELSTAGLALRSVRTSLAQVMGRISEFNSRLAAIDKRIQSIPVETAALEREVVRLEASRTGAGVKQEQLGQDLLALNLKRNQAEGALNQAKSLLSSLELVLNAKRTDLSAVRAQFQSLSAELSSLENEATALAARLSAIEQELKQIQAQVRTAQTEFTAATKVISDLESKLPALEQEVVRAQNQLNAQSTRVAQIRASLQVQNQNLTRISDELNGRSQYVSDLKAHIQGTRQEIQDSEERVAENTRRILANQSAVLDQSAYIVDAKRQLSVFRSTQSALENKLPELRSAYEFAEQVAKEAESITASKYADYRSRFDLYQNRLAEAEAQGREQGLPIGSEMGRAQGLAAGAKEGAEQGRSRGREEGLLFGLNEGKKQGEEKGFADGREKGLNSISDYQTGYQNGSAQGQKNADLEAKQVDFARARDAEFARLTSVLPSRQVESDQETIRASIVNVKPSRRALVFAQDLEGSRFGVLGGSPRCDQSYVDFVRACQLAYEEALKAARDQAYLAAYNEVFSTAFESARAAAFNDSKGIRVQEGFKSVYEQSVSRGFKVGAQEAQNKGLTQGLADGYARRIELARAEATQAGVLYTQSFFSKNAVIQLLDMDLVREGLDGVQGGAIGVSDSVKLRLKLANFGNAASTRTENPVRVEIQALTHNLLIEKSTVVLSRVAESSVNAVSRVLSAKVLEGAAGGSLEQLKVRVILPDGNSLERVLDVVVQPNLKVKIASLDFDTSPRVGKYQKLKVGLNNFGNLDPKEVMTLVLSSKESPSVVRVDSAEVQVYELPAGSNYLIHGLGYTILTKEAANRGVMMNLALKHGSRIVTSMDFRVGGN